MAVLLAAGLAAETALAAVEAAMGGRGQRLAAAARAGLLDGRPLAAALAAAAPGLPGWYLAAVAAGEKAGALAAVFEALASQLERAEGERGALGAALAYPAFVVAVALVVCGVLMTTVAPEIAAVFAGSGRPLPPLTAAVLAATGWTVAHGPGLAAGLVALAGLGLLAARRPAWRDRRDRLVLRLPLAGRLLRQAEAAAWLRTLALVLGARLPLTEALDEAAAVLAVAAHARAARTAAEAVRRGGRLGPALAGLPFLHPVMRQLLEAGEAGARLAPAAERAAGLAESWMKAERQRLVALLEPAAMLLVGLVVLVVVMAVLLPVFDMPGMVSP
jgi:general secretion pathway protein F